MLRGEASGLLPGEAAVDCAPLGAVVGFRRTYLFALKADVRDGMCADALVRKSDRVPRGAVVLGVVEK